MATEPHEPMPQGSEAPPHGIRAMAIVRWVLLLAIAALALWSVLTIGRRHGASGVLYTCPMVEHAFVVTDEPGDCPLCHMTLMPLDPALIEARKQQLAAQRDSTHLPGLTPITVHLDRAQRMGVRSVPVAESAVDEAVRAPVYVASPEQGESRVHARAAGFLERIAVSEVGAKVSAGQVLASLYAPDILRAQEEYLVARRWGEGDGAKATIAAARRRLELLGLSGADIAAIEQRGETVRTVPVRAPAAGVIVRRTAALGAYVTPEMPLYEIVDLRRAYLVADVLTTEAAALQPGTTARVTLGTLGEVNASVDLVYPEVNPEARTTRVRLRVAEPHPALAPGLYGTALFAASHRRALRVPRDAVIDTGTRRYVFVDQGEGSFDPRPVVTGEEHDGMVEIRQGLAAGDRVVATATFLIDAESRLEAAFTGPAPSSSAPSGPSSAVPPVPAAPAPSAPRGAP